MLALFSLLWLAAPAPSAPSAQEAALQRVALNALAQVEAWRGQKLSRPLKMGVKDKAEITAFIRERLKDEYGPVKVEAEGALLKLQGLLPEALDYQGFITSLLTEQVAGFYDHTRQELHIADWLPGFMQAPILAHEILHAIQDDKWGAGKLIDSKVYSHDQVLAHAALLEGDATLLTFNYPRKSIDPDAEDVATSPVMVKMLAASLPLQMSSPQFPVMASAPDYLKQSLIFPYQQGMLFVSAVRNSGVTLAELPKVYQDPPSSTEQILHPERYLTRDHPSLVKLHPLAEGRARPWAETAGEFHLRQLLLSGLPQLEAEAAATGWDGDQTALERWGERSAAVTLSVWDSEAQAGAFEAALLKVMAARQAPKPSLVTQRRGDVLAFAFAAEASDAEAAVKAALDHGVVTRR
ncbi:hypothetical protein KKF91_01530 [Myxococcota bacterium]|nr:hypothetical protein [Myxococcota bacterium]MBU1429218.1 hypothetical protein [Myxococcota bacterium]MBU1900332.1 hypothetical protein [Myxococcota bacterium]